MSKVLSGDIHSMYPHTMTIVKIPDFSVEEVSEFDGSRWYTISVFIKSLDDFLKHQCEVNDEHCFEGSTSWSKMNYMMTYNVHETLYTYISLRWNP